MAGPRLAQGGSDLESLGGGGSSEPFAERGGAGVDLELGTGLRVRQLDHPHGGQGELAGVAYLDGQHLMTA